MILAHRGNSHGPSTRENRRDALAAALRRGWGVEVDLRRTTDGRFHLSHDPGPGELDQLAAPFFADVRRHPGVMVAVNIKECGYEPEMVAFLKEQRVIDRLFLFDMELVEPVRGEATRLLRSLEPQLTLAARVSDRDEPVERALAVTEASVIWLDEFDGPWATASVVQRLKAAGRVVYAVSPELHGRPLEDAQRRWADFARWGVDGICTDYPAQLEASGAALEAEVVA